MEIIEAGVEIIEDNGENRNDTKSWFFDINKMGKLWAKLWKFE